MWKEPECYDRDKLYEEVWSKPVYKVAEEYGISNVAIAKICRRMHIPVPQRGYWSKLISGQKLKKIPLPKFDECPTIRRQFRRPEEIEKKKAERLVQEAFALEAQLIQRESLPEMKIKCDPTIKLSNQYVRNTEKNLNESKKNISKYYGYSRCGSVNDEALEVYVGPDNIQRALVILQTICDALTARGYSIGTKPKKAHAERQYNYGSPQREAHPVYAFVLDTYISFRITERLKKRLIEEKNRKYSYQKYEYVLSGLLCFEILNYSYESYARSKWEDGKVIRVEDSLNDIIINMIKVATIKKEDEAQSAKQREQLKIEEDKRQEREKLERIEKARIQNLIKETERMIKLNQIRGYIELIAVEGKMRLDESYLDSDFSKWLEWAETFLEKNNLKSWELPKFDLPDPQKFNGLI